MVRGGIGVTEADAVVAVYPPIFVPPVTVQVFGAVLEKVSGTGSAANVAAVGVVVKASC